MSETQTNFTFFTTVISAIMAAINGILIANANGAIVIVFSSFQANTVDEVINATSFWGRIVLGVPGIVEGSWAYFWLIFPFLMLVIAYLIYRKPRANRTFGILIAVLSILTLPIGGGFYLGAILGFVGGIAGYEWPKKFGETLLGKIFRAAIRQPKFYTKICEDPKSLSDTALAVIIIGLISGLGNGLYTYNAYLIKKGGVLAQKILLGGSLYFNEVVLITSISFVGVMLLKWLILSLSVYWIGAKLVGTNFSYDTILRTTGFAFAPEIFMVVLPVMFSNEPTLTFNWPLGLYILTRVWTFLCLLVAIRQTFDFSFGRTFGVAILAGAIYWIIYHIILAPALNIPGIRLTLAMPESSLAILTLFGLTTLISVGLKVFSTKRMP